MNEERVTFIQRSSAFMRRHPLVCYLVVMALALLTGPLLVAASQATAVLYKDF